MAYSIRSPNNRTSLVDAWCDRPIVNTNEEATPAILAALAGTGRCELGDGRYMIDPALTTLVIDGLIYGRGIRRSTLKLVSGSTGIGLRFASNSRGFDFTVEGNDEANTSACSTVSGGAVYSVALDRVRMKDCANGFGPNGVVRGLKLTNCEFESNTAFGLFSTAASSSIEILNSLFKDNPEHMQFQSGPRAGLILGNDFDGGTTGLTLGTARDFFVAGNRFNVSGTPIVTPSGRGTNLGPNFNAAGVELDGAAIVSNTRCTYNGKFFSTAIPNAGVWQVGDFVHNRSPGNTQPVGWLCDVAGDFAGTPPTFAATYRGRREIHAHYNHTFGSIVSGASEVVSPITLTGAELGDWIDASIEAPLPAGFQLHAVVTAADTVRAQLSNIGGSTETLGFVTLHLLCRKHA